MLHLFCLGAQAYDCYRVGKKETTPSVCFLGGSKVIGVWLPTGTRGLSRE